MKNVVLTAPRQPSRVVGVLSDRAVQDGAFAALIVLSRIPANVGPIGAAVGLALMGIYAVLRLDQCRATLARCYWQLAYPLFALTSILWAVYPTITARASVQMTITAFAGLLISQAARPRAVLVGLFLSFGGYTLGSFAAGNTRPDGITGAPALFGLGGEAKNYFADSAATGALLAMVMVVVCVERRAYLHMLMCGFSAAICFVATERARSAGAMASLALAASLLLVLMMLRNRSPFVKASLTVAVLAASVLCAVFFDQLIAAVQQLSGKDAGLTGRGYLWYRAEFIIAQRPWLGTGYFGFWTPLNPDAVGFWRYFDIRQEGTAFSFHNSYIQTIVETGYVGVAVLVLTWVAGILALLRRFVLTASLPTCFWLAYLALELSKSPVEPIRPAALVAPTIMLFAALGFGWFPIGRPGQADGAASRSRSLRSSAAREDPRVSAMNRAEIRLTPPATAM